MTANRLSFYLISLLLFALEAFAIPTIGVKRPEIKDPVLDRIKAERAEASNNYKKKSISESAKKKMFELLEGKKKEREKELAKTIGVKESDIESLWTIIENSIKTDEYVLISRAALNAIDDELNSMQDLRFNDQSGHGATLGKIEGIDYILYCDVSKMGSKFVCTLRVMKSSTGRIEQHRTATLRFSDFDELADIIEGTVENLLSDEKTPLASAVLPAIIKFTGAPSNLGEEFSSLLENALINNGIQLQNLANVKKILNDHKMSQLNELQPKMYKRVGQLLDVKCLIQPVITRCTKIMKSYNVVDTGAKGTRVIGYNLEGYVRVISAQNGRVLGNTLIREQLNYRSLDPDMTEAWVDEDYIKYLLEKTVNEKVVTALMNIKALTEEETTPKGKR